MHFMWGYFVELCSFCLEIQQIKFYYKHTAVMSCNCPTEAGTQTSIVSIGAHNTRSTQIESTGIRMTQIKSTEYSLLYYFDVHTVGVH